MFALLVKAGILNLKMEGLLIRRKGGFCRGKIIKWGGHFKMLWGLFFPKIAKRLPTLQLSTKEYSLHFFKFYEKVTLYIWRSKGAETQTQDCTGGTRAFFS